jgi:hypothetical protein
LSETLEQTVRQNELGGGGGAGAPNNPCASQKIQGANGISAGNESGELDIY